MESTLIHTDIHMHTGYRWNCTFGANDSGKQFEHKHEKKSNFVQVNAKRDRADKIDCTLFTIHKCASCQHQHQHTNRFQSKIESTIISCLLLLITHKITFFLHTQNYSHQLNFECSMVIFGICDTIKSMWGYAFICWLFFLHHCTQTSHGIQINLEMEKRKEKQFNTSNKWNSMHKIWIQREMMCIFSTFVVIELFNSSFLLHFLIKFYFAFHFSYTTRNVSHCIDTALRRILTTISWWSCWTITRLNLSMYLCLHSIPFRSFDVRCMSNSNSSIIHTCECIGCAQKTM